VTIRVVDMRDRAIVFERIGALYDLKAPIGPTGPL
jgi:hypothetical protein